jgi:hypothetical protein
MEWVFVGVFSKTRVISVEVGPVVRERQATGADTVWVT